jgi:hypothetical protein
MREELKTEILEFDYKHGQIIYPDYVSSDTLIVVMPDELNEEMPNCDFTDWGINEVLARNCMTFDQFVVELYGYGEMSLNDARYYAEGLFGRRKKDEKFYLIKSLIIH